MSLSGYPGENGQGVTPPVAKVTRSGHVRAVTNLSTGLSNVMETPPQQLVRIFFWQAIDQIGQKWPYLVKNGPIWPKKAIFGQKWTYLAKNASFGSYLAIFGPKIHFLGGGSKPFGTLISGNQ